MGENAHTEVGTQDARPDWCTETAGSSVESIEGKISFEWLDEEVSRSIMNPTKTHKLQIHSYVDIFDADGLKRISRIR